MHGAVRGKAPDYVCILITLTDDNDVACDLIGIRKMSHNLELSLKKLGNRYFQIVFESGMSYLWIFGK